MNKPKTIYEKEKKPGVCYAVAKNGLELPVIDITTPAFMVDSGEEHIRLLERQMLKDSENFTKIPLFIRKIMIPLLFRGSFLGRGMMASAGTYLNGITTYLMKLGVENLGKGYATAMDRNIADSLGSLSLRMRLRDIAHMMADDVKPVLLKRPDEQLHFINISGGPSMDTLNAVILLNKETPGLIKNREIKIHILDMDDTGPDFAVNSLKSLQLQGAPLQGLKIEIILKKYDWSDTAGLERYMRDNIHERTVAVLSSEGGMFDYCPDETLFENMKAIYSASPDDAILAGTLTPRDKMGRYYNSFVNSTVERDPEEFGKTILKSGWRIEKSLAQPFSIVIGMKKHRLQ
jgi:hypothetical protein